ncbi:hypothetical protein [Novosphingobium malaysiense]|uniref:HEAT repeat domain-containing protein n=1 Tax=Novosphingobium malaysiense TaxID=1348853 RepID=A0A0B1ZJB7_9SPHN|nr:hypothetical protein [Novosphingobium malaysiense]KHK89393.1 hypothetical protein LK12_19870 [Novosphingobium malaysiense]
MSVNEALAALRQEEETVEIAQAALADRVAEWRADPCVASVFEAMDRFGKGAALDLCPALADLFAAETPQARRFAEVFVSAGLDGLRAHPLGQMPLSHGRRNAVPVLVLASSGRASLALAAYEGAALAALPAPRTARFSPQETWIHVLSGTGTADLILRRDGPDDREVLQSGAVELRPGTAFYRYGPRQALQVRSVQGSLVLLRLQRAFADTEPAREFSLPDGTLVHQAAAQPHDTRLELAVSVLARMGRKDAVGAMAAIASGDTFKDASQSLRWQALREVLALDTAAGLDLLARLSADPEDPLSHPVASLHASLLDTWPDLERTSPWSE